MNRMNDDLISRKVLIADMKSRKYIDKALCEIFETVVDEAPTAFDKEKVIEELEYDKEMSSKYSTGLREQGHIEAFDEAISIVKKGGINNVLS